MLCKGMVIQRKGERHSKENAEAFYDIRIQLLPLNSMIVSPIFTTDINPMRLITTNLCTLP